MDTANDVKAPLLSNGELIINAVAVHGEQRRGVEWGGAALRQEIKRIAYLAGPMVAVLLSQYSLQVISMMMVGHLGELALSSTAIAVSLAGVTGFSLLLGMASALETLCGQSYGAEQYKRLGTQTYTAIFSLLLVSIPLSVLWIFMEKVFILIGQDPKIAHEAGRFIIWLIPALVSYAFLQPLVRYFQSQSLVIPMLLSSLATLALHVPLCWILVFKSGLKNVGAAVAMGISYWLNVAFLALYMRYSSACAKTRSPLSMDVFRGISEFFQLALPSAFMVCLEWWAYELLILLSGLLPNPQLETSVLSICLTSLSTLYAVPYGLGAAVSTRVSNELGAGNPVAARLSVRAVMCLTVAETLIVCSTLLGSRHVFGYLFSNEKEVVDYVASMIPLLCLTVLMDSIQGVLSGVARGCGWQHLGAWVNLGAFYIFGIPIACGLGFTAHWRGRGLWIGNQVGSVLQSLMLSTITCMTNWESQANNARQRVFQGSPSLEKGLLQ